MTTIKEIVFVSNYYNHHQSELSESLYKLTEGGFVFIQTQPMEKERIDMGWHDSDLPVFVKKSYGNAENYRECLELINSAKTVIIGGADFSFIKQRVKDGKLTIRYSERLLKKGFGLIKYPYRLLKLKRQNPKKGNIYLLCSGAFTEGDYRKFGLFKGKTFKWGYFPSVKKYDDIEEIIEKKERGSILWVARFIKFKHPEAPLFIAKKLKEEGYSFTLNMIGGGILEEKIKERIKKENLTDNVKLLGTMSPEKVRENMEKSEIFLFTSDRNEGWGAVLNESMNSGCAVIASGAIGSVPYLIKDGENGEIYKDGDLNDLYRRVKGLITDEKRRKGYGINAYKTMLKTWNAEVAAERLLTLIEKINNGKDTPYIDGPCSMAYRQK